MTEEEEKVWEQAVENNKENLKEARLLIKDSTDKLETMKQQEKSDKELKDRLENQIIKNKQDCIQFVEDVK